MSTETRTLPDGRELRLDSADVADRLEIRADIRRSIQGRKSVQEDKPDRVAALLDEAATEIRRLRALAAPEPAPLHKVVAIRVVRMWESCQRTTFAVELRTDEGFTMTPCSHRTGSVYTEFVGLSEDEARERALIDADRWGDFLGIVPAPFTHDGVTYEPEMTMRPYETRRILAARRKGPNSTETD